ncbi:MAG: hypothetical protein OEU92_28680, partial [Alphaproteobacteria bacterium]|nr:hypothetical protein [Alphaproteobacteria bacterium]
MLGSHAVHICVAEKWTKPRIKMVLLKGDVGAGLGIQLAGNRLRSTEIVRTQALAKIEESPAEFRMIFAKSVEQLLLVLSSFCQGLEVGLSDGGSNREMSGCVASTDSEPPNQRTNQGRMQPGSCAECPFGAKPARSGGREPYPWLGRLC